MVNTTDSLATLMSYQKTEEYSPQSLLIKYRKLGGWTQQQLAAQVKLSSSRIVRKWETGENLPKTQTLKLLIELCIRQNIFLPDQIEQEARRFWSAVKEAADKNFSKSKFYPEFDEKWFSQIVQSTKQEPVPSPDIQNVLLVPNNTNSLNYNVSAASTSRTIHQPLLTTKLFVPKARQDLVSRNQLIKLLQKGLQEKLTLISAPAGFGKTTLVCDWYSSYTASINSSTANPQRVAWISLDENDNDPVRFLRYVIYALQKAGLQIDVTILEQLFLLRPLPLENVLTEFINQLNTIVWAFSDTLQTQPSEIVLVLDDYHLIKNEAVHQIVSFLLEHSPEQLHLLIISRIDPPLPLHRLRVRGQLIEIRANDLRFDLDEISEFVVKIGNVTLNKQQLAKLAETTEGWVASLQLAILAMQGQANPTNFINSFSGNNYLVLDYLIKEVLNQQTEKIRNFLLATAHLERFNASLASALTGTEWSNSDLLELQKANLFFTPLDEVGEWYRYHHLFADVLRHQLQIKQPKLLPELQLKASQWFEQNNLIYEAIVYALACQAYEQASKLIANFYDESLSRSDFDLLERQLLQIPTTNLIKYPELCFNAVVFAFYNHNFGRREEQLVEGLANLVDTENRTEWTGKLFVLRMMVARYQNDMKGFIYNSEQALLHLPDDDLFERSRINISLAAIYLNQGEITKILNLLLPLNKMYIAKGNLEAELSLLFVLADINAWQGQLKQSTKLLNQIIRQTEGTWVNPLLIYLRLAHIYWEWNEQNEAYKYLKKVEELMELGGWKMGQFIYFTLWTEDNLPKSTREFTDNIGIENQLPADRDILLKQQITELRSRLQIQVGEPVSEEIRSEEIYFDAKAILNNPIATYQQEPQYLKSARILIEKGKLSEAQALLEDLKTVATTQGRVHSLIKLLLLQTETLVGSENIDEAEKVLEQALTLAEPGGYIRTFVKHGNLEKLLLSKKLQSNKLASYVKQLLAAFENQRESTVVTSDTSPTITSNPKLVETLTNRELTILRMMSMGASNQEIADELVLAIGTVKKHVTNIFGKLGVTNRTQALISAQKLGLV